MLTKWYTTTKENDPQGLICDESNGKNIAVSYDPQDANLIAAAPELLEVLEKCSQYVGMHTCPKGIVNKKAMDLYREISATIRKAKGE